MSSNRKLFEWFTQNREDAIAFLIAKGEDPLEAEAAYAVVSAFLSKVPENATTARIQRFFRIALLLVTRAELHDAVKQLFEWVRDLFQ